MARQLRPFSLRMTAAAAGLLLATAVGLPHALAQATSSAPQPAVPTAPASAPVAESRPARAPTLATRVPGDAMLYLEIAGISGGSRGAGASIIAGLLHVLQPAPASAPVSAVEQTPDLRQLFATAVGIEDAAAVDALLSGPLAVAADGWSGLSDAVLLAWPKNPAALEKALAGKRIAETETEKVRRYALGHDHELACDGQTAAVGRMTRRTSLFGRTLELLQRGGTGNLAEQTDFRERTAGLPADSQFILFIGKAPAAANGPAQDPLTAWWPEDWPRLRTVAMGLAFDSNGVTIKVSSQLDPAGPQLAHSEPPIEIVRHLPGTVLAVWTQVIDYLGGYRRLRARFSHDPDGFHFDSLEAGLDAGTIEQRLLGHLVGDTVLVIDRIQIRPQDATTPSEHLVLPAAALMVETDDPDTVASSIAQVAGNLVRLFNQQLPPEQAIALKEEPLGAGGPVLYSLDLGRVLGAKSKCDLLQSLELSAAVADRWLIVGTHKQTVQRLVEARRRRSMPLQVRDLDTIIENVVARGGQPRRIMFAQPRVAAAMIQSWLQHIGQYHREMLEPQWWEQVLRRQRAMGKQMGLLARPADGTVEIVDTLPGGPARDVLQPGDRIVAVDGTKLAASNPLQSLRESVAERKRAQVVTLSVMRGDQTLTRDLILPSDSAEVAGTSPVELLRRVAGMLRLFSSASYVLWQPRPDIIDARIDLRYLPSTQPASEPAVR